jgi:hypothetical protein
MKTISVDHTCFVAVDASQTTPDAMRRATRNERFIRPPFSTAPKRAYCFSLYRVAQEGIAYLCSPPTKRAERAS